MIESSEMRPARRVIETLRKGEELPAEWSRELFPPEKREYELVYHDKAREEDVFADTMAVPLQPVRTFGKNDHGWSNMLLFGDNPIRSESCGGLTALNQSYSATSRLICESLPAWG